MVIDIQMPGLPSFRDKSVGLHRRSPRKGLARRMFAEKATTYRLSVILSRREGSPTRSRLHNAWGKGEEIPRDGSEWPVKGIELRFGFDSEESLPALELDEDVRLRGIIDRVDADIEGHAIVRDYKSGSARPEHQGARWATDRQLQVALYMIAVRELLGLEPVAGFYQPLGGGDLRARGVFLKGAAPGERLVGNDGRSSEEIEELLDEARWRALALAGRLRAGELEPCPATCSRDGCKYPGICRA